MRPLLRAFPVKGFSRVRYRRSRALVRLALVRFVWILVRGPTTNLKPSAHASVIDMLARYCMDMHMYMCMPHVHAATACT